MARAISKAKKKPHYVNNKEFYERMLEFKEAVAEAEKEGKTRPPVTRYIGSCIMKIAVRLSHKPNFINYTFREEMIGDGVENCLQYIDNFNPEKSKNPFAYFTQIIYYAFLRRIQKEKKHLYTKYKLTERANIFDMTSDKQSHDKFSVYNDEIKYNDWSQEYVSNFVSDFEENKRRKVKKRKQTVDSLLEAQD